MRNHEVTAVQPLLKADGSLREPGWSKQLYQIYDRNAIKAKKSRIKEWDYYIILSPKNNFGVAFTISDCGYFGLQSVTFFDFSVPCEHTKTIFNLFPMGKYKLPSVSSKGNTEYHDSQLDLEYRVSAGKRRILCNSRKFQNGKTLSCDITLEQPDMDTMVIATPWKEKSTAFYYNQKINCMRASGRVTLDGKEYVFDPSTDFGTLDWGRGVWTYDNRWFWGSGNCDIDGHSFGFNIGYGFGDTTSASENMLFYDGKCHKLDDVKFNIPATGYTDPWTFTSSDGRFEMSFKPIIDRSAKVDVKFMLTDQHQVFGKLSGKAVLDDGTVIEVKDMLCFAEDVHNRY